jgi:hypothetical protein
MIIVNNALGDIPEKLEDNQFYCFNKKNGEITIGEIIGVSVTSYWGMYKIGKREIKINYVFSEYTRSFKINNDETAFKDYQDLLDAYTKYAEKKVKKAAASRITRYVVNKETFLCRQTRATYLSWNEKAFDTKQEATAYAEKGLTLLGKKVAKYLATFNDLKKQLSELNPDLYYAKNGIVYSLKGVEQQNDDDLLNIMATPKNLTEKDYIGRIIYKHYKTQNIPTVDESYIVTPSKRIGPEIVKLSDGTLLAQSDCRPYSSPMLFKYQYLQRAKDICKLRCIKRFIKDIDYRLDDLKRLEKHVQNYHPFMANYSTSPYFGEKWMKEMIEDAKEILKDFKKDEKTQDNN